MEKTYIFSVSTRPPVKLPKMDTVNQKLTSLIVHPLTKKLTSLTVNPLTLDYIVETITK